MCLDEGHGSSVTHSHDCIGISSQQSRALGFNFQIMVEEYLDGPEVDVDCVLNNGRLVYAHVVDNWYVPMH